jgi:RNA polymerase sigma-70 factor (ECF subfamily)
MNSSDPQPQNGPAEDWQTEELLVETFARYQDELLGMLYYLVGNMEDARDTLQESFLKCWRRRRSLTVVENMRAWIFRVALNAGRDARNTAWRRKRQPLGADSHQLPSTNPGPSTEAMRREQMTRLRDAIYQLRPEEQQVFLLRQNGQMTYDQIAQAMGIPTGTAKTRMRLALGKLREALQPAEPNQSDAPRDDSAAGPDPPSAAKSDPPPPHDDQDKKGERAEPGHPARSVWPSGKQSTAGPHGADQRPTDDRPPA